MTDRSPRLADDRDAVVARLRRLKPGTSRQWGRMTAHEMVRHLHESFRATLGELPVTSLESWLGRVVIRRIALHSRQRWPKGLRTMPELDQAQLGVRGRDFGGDIAALEEMTARFAVASNARVPGMRHPVFGPLTDDEWQLWGWRHMDHHLRQFGL